MDLSRHMAKILTLDLEAGFVSVEPGVVLDDLNAFLKPHGVYFAANLSPSNRATLGGMVATDASGEGSRRHGKTSQHVVDLEVVLRGGIVHRTARVAGADLDALCAEPGLLGQAHKLVREIATARREEIASTFPKLRRYMTGYNLVHMAASDGSAVDLAQLVVGSEGSLGVVTEARLRLTHFEPHRALLVLRYPSFDAALASARVAGRDRSGLGGDSRRDGPRAREERRHLRPGARLSRGQRPRDDARHQPRRVQQRRGSQRPGQGRRAPVGDRPAPGQRRRPAWPRDRVEAERARELVEPSKEGRGAPGQRARAAQTGALRRGHGRPAREPAGVRARVPRVARRRGAALRHVRPRRRRLPARAARARPEGSRRRSARAAHHRRSRRSRDPLRGTALGRARQGLSLRARAAPFRPGSLPRAPADQGRVRPTQPAQPRKGRHAGGRPAPCSREWTARRGARSTGRSRPPTARRSARSSTATATASASTRAPTT